MPREDLAVFSVHVRAGDIWRKGREVLGAFGKVFEEALKLRF